MERIQLTCECCNKVWDLPRTNEIPANVSFMHCNYCIECEDAGRMEDYYEEWYDENDGEAERPPIPISDNQLCLPFLFEEIGIKEKVCL